MNELAGRWQLCALPPGAPPDAIGVELVPPAGWDGGAYWSDPVEGGYPDIEGNLYYLVDGPSGPVRGQGFAYESQWDVAQFNPPAQDFSIILNGQELSFLYSPCPKQFEISIYYDAGGVGANADVLLVPMR